MGSWDPSLAGPRIRRALDAVVRELLAGREDRGELRQAALDQSDVVPKTFDCLLGDLAHYGVVVRMKRGKVVRLTTLGRTWAEEWIEQEGG